MLLKIILVLYAFGRLGQALPINDDGFETKIIGGVNVARGEMPWMVSLQYNSFGTLRHICGGVLLNSTHVLTAGHCVKDISLQYLTVVAGALRLFVNEPYEQTRAPISTNVHPRYENGEVTRHDIGLLEVNPPFNLNTYVSSITLPPQDHVATGACTIAGWGQTATSSSSDFLLKATVPIVSKAKCEEYYGPEVDTTNQVCAGYDGGGYDTCKGDTGGPLTCDDIGYTYVAGISSFGYSCGQPKKPGVYTEVSHYTSGFAPPVYIDLPRF